MKILCSLFPKLFRVYQQTYGYSHETGFEAVDLLLRDGYRVDMDNMAAEAKDLLTL